MDPHVVTAKGCQASEEQVITVRMYRVRRSHSGRPTKVGSDQAKRTKRLRLGSAKVGNLKFLLNVSFDLTS
jgi:hypothetical protein